MASSMQLEKLNLTSSEIEELENQEMFGHPFSPINIDMLLESQKSDDLKLNKQFFFNFENSQENDMIKNAASNESNNSNCANKREKEEIKAENSNPHDTNLNFQNRSSNTLQNIKSKKRLTRNSKDEGIYYNKESNMIYKSNDFTKESKSKDNKQILRKSQDSHHNLENFQASSKLDTKYLRWGKDQDCELYRHILELQSNGVCSIEDLINLNKPISIKYKRILWKICEETKWRGPTFYMLKRIKRIFKYHRFSVRQVTLLKRIIRKEYSYKDLDYNSIGLHFPGKSIESITSMCNQILIEKRKIS